MRINQNIMAFNAYRNLNTTSDALTSSLEKLSSGFRINRAADDAAGLVKSESLRAEIGGTNQAIPNAQDGVSFVQTAEGSLNEVQAILQRVRDLAVSAANTATTDGAAQQAEINQLNTELDAIGTRTTFGGRAVFTDYSASGAALAFQVGAGSGGANQLSLAQNLKLDTTTTAGLFSVQLASIDVTTNAGATSSHSRECAMAAPISSVTGLSSGLDTNKIITELMSIEQAPLTRLQASVTTYQKQMSAWATVRSTLSALQSAAAALTNSSDIAALVTATSSSGAAGASVTGTPSLGTVSFTVDQLAAAHQAAGASTFSGGADLVGAGTFSLTVGSTTTPFTTSAGTTLSQLASQVNASHAGVAAAVVAVDATTSKLVLTATATGAAAAFTASGTQASLATFNVLQQGVDAKITIATGANATQLARPSNQISDFISGVSIGLTALSATPVSVTVAQDPTAVVKAVQGVVNAYNAAYTTLRQSTSYNPTSKTAGVLLDDPTASGLLGQLNQVLANQVTGLAGPYTSASSIGITMQADGTFALDQGKLTTALATNPSAVTSLLA